MRPSLRKILSTLDVLAGEWRDLARRAVMADFVARPGMPAMVCQLEDRVLLSASPAAAAGDGSSADAPNMLDACAWATTVGADAPADACSEATPDQAASDGHSTMRRELLFLDAGLERDQKLIGDLADDRSDRWLSIVVLDTDRDGLEQIAAALAEHTDLDAVHFVSHGTLGTVKLGGTWLNVDSLRARAGEIALWAQSLGADADLLFYGCDFAGNEDGRTLIESLAALTGADVAASTDHTGHAQFAGDWELEFQTGSIESRVAFSQSTQENWRDLLGVIAVSTVNDVLDGNTSSIAALLGDPGTDGFISLREAIIATNNTAGADTVMLASGSYSLTRTGAGDDAANSGDLDITDTLTISGTSANTTFIDGVSADRVFEIHGCTVTISGVTIQHGHVSDGGGVRVNDSGSLTMFDATLTGNAGTSTGGAVFVSGTLNLARVTISGNTADVGGGVYVNNGANVSLTNVTLSGNTATSNGGAIFARNPIAVTNSTIAFNTAGGAGGIHTQGGGGANLKNTILANNTGGNSSDALVSLGYNIDSGNTAGLTGPGDQINTDPLLDPVLADNGGFLPTHRLLAGSPAINAGTATGAPATDQRGASRVGATDIGSYEFDCNTLVVDTTADVADGDTSSVAALLASKGIDGKISLREAIIATNNTANLASPDRIYFAIVGAGPHTINVSAGGLPDITDAVLIDGTTEPDFAGTPVIELNGSGAGASTNGLLITGGGATIRGLVINRFSANGILITGAGGNAIAGNYLGTDVTGAIDRGNGLDGIRILTASNIVGGLTAAERNVISANNIHGVRVYGESADSNIVQGNYIGLNAAGTTALGNSLNGIIIYNGADDNLVGGASLAARNVISGNYDTGVEIQDSTSTGNRIEGNIIGLNASGTAALGNLDGVIIEDAPNNVVGGATTAQRNIISGNFGGSQGNGVVIFGNNATGNLVQNNYIGTDVTGMLDRGNAGSGILISDNGDGGSSAGPASANAIRDNVISGNNYAGVSITRSGVDNNVIRGNYIGTDATASGALGNTTFGVAIWDGPSGNQVGGTNPGDGNIIAFNNRGVLVDANPTASTGNPILGNRIFGQTGLGIDLNNDGLTPNDSGDGDGGPNRRQNFPVLTAASTTGSDITIDGSLNSTASRTYRIEFFASVTGDATGHGEGERYLGFTNVTTNGSGNCTINVTLTAVVAAGEFISATATNLTTNDTSEFAQNFLATAVNSPPTITSNGGGATAGISVAENGTAVTVVTATDAEAPPQILSYSIVGGADAAKFVIDSSTGALSFLTAPNYELPTDVEPDNVYEVTVQVSDGSLTDAQTVTVTVTNVNEAPLNTVPGPQSTGQDAPLVFSSGNGNAISISDVDAASGQVQVTLTATNGTLSLRWPSGTANAAGGEIGINTTTSDRQATLDGEFHGAVTSDFGGPRAVASDPSGNFVVTWSSKNQDGDGWGIYAQRYNVAGVPQAGSFRVNTTTAKDQVHSSVAMDDVGNFVIVWSSQDQDGDNSGVYGQRYNAAGVAQGGEFQVNTYTNKEQLGASVAMDRTGNFVVTWSSKDQDGNDWGVYAKRFSAAGVPQGGEFRVNNTTTKQQTASSVAMCGDGAFVVTWSSKDQDGNNWGVYAKRFDNAGVPQGSEFRVNTTTNKEQEFSSVAVSASGDFVVTWSSKDQDGDNWGVYAQRYSAAGVAQGGEFRVNVNTAKEQMHPSVAVDTDGDFVITWTSNDQDGSGRGVYARQYTSTGVPKGGETLVNTTTAGDQEYSSVAMDARGGFVVVWTGNGPGDNLGVFGQQFDVPAGLTFTTGDGTRDATMTFSGSLAQINLVLEGLTFAPDTGFNGLATVTITTDDQGNTGSGGALSDTDSVNITVGTGNVAPTLTVTGGPLSYTENDPATVIDGGGTVSDPDSADFDGGQFTVFLSANGTSFDQLAIRHQGTAVGQLGVAGNDVTYNYGAGAVVIGSFAGGTDGVTPLVVTLSANANVVAVQALARNITFQNVSDDPSTLPRTIAWRLTDGDGGASTIQSTVILVTAVNDAPVITSDGGGDTASLTVAENQTAVTTVTSADVDGGLPSYAISGGPDGALFSINATTGELTFQVAPNREVPADTGLDNVYHVTVLVSDGMLTDTQDITVTVTDVDEFDVTAPVDSDGTANAVDENAANGTTVGITASASDADSTNNTVTYSLTIDAGGRFAINASTGAVTVADGSLLDREAAASHTITVRATSADGSTADTMFTINLNDVDEFDVVAVTDSNAAPNTVAENAVVGTTVGLTGLATDADATNNTITYSLDDNAGGRFAIDTNTGVVTVNGALDYETATSHSVTIRATSSDGSTAAQNFTIAVTDVNESGIGPISDTDAAADTVLENSPNGTTVGLTAFADDPDGTDTVSYSLDNNAGGRFAIHATTGVVTVAGGIDREAAGSYSITVRATSSDTSTTTRTFTITIGDVDEFNVTAPTDSDAAANAVDENAANGTAVGITASASDADATTNTITYSLTNDAGGRFTINASTGAVTVANGSLLDREAAASHNITVRATSSDGSTADTMFTINLNDVDEFDVVAVTDSNAAPNTAAENAVVGTTVGLTGLATDADATNNTITYSLDDNAGGRFAIDTNTGVVRVNGTLDYETATSHSITIRATSSDGSTAAQNFTIAVTDVNESGIGPISDTDAAADTVLENSANGTTVGLTAFADDPDGTDTVSYSLDDNAGGRFAIHATTGVVTVNGALDHETATSHSVTIRATSSDGSFSTQNFTIAVTDLNDNAPVLVHNDLILMEGETVTLANGNLQSVDPDGTPVVLTYTVGGVTGGRFERAASPGVGITLFTQPEVDLGQIVFVHDGGELAPTYAVTVSDGVFLVGPQAATISFTNVNDAPHAANVSFEVGTSTLLGSLLSWVEDADGDPLAFLLLTAPTAGTLQLAPDGSFSYAPANTMAGVCSFAYQVSDGQATSNVAVVSITVLLDGVLPPPGDGHIRSDRDSSSSDDSSEAPPPNSPLDVDGGMLVPEAVPHGPAKTSTSTDTTDRPSDPGLTSDANAEPEFQQPLAVLARGDAESGVMRPQPSATVDADNSTAVQDEARVGDGAAGETGVFVHLGQSGALWRELDEFHQTVESGTDVSAIAIGSVGTIASGLTVGYVLWVLRSGLVLSSILASLPAWTMFDPLVVVSASGRMDEEQDEESLEDLVENQAAWAAERQRENRITEPLP